jgi:hypothetical protein
MIEKEQLDQILQFVAQRWIEISKDPQNKAMKVLPSDFWMNSIGGKAGNGRWVTMLMYTENNQDADALKEVLLRWQAKGMQENSAPDLIQIKKNRH